MSFTKYPIFLFLSISIISITISAYSTLLSSISSLIFTILPYLIPPFIINSISYQMTAILLISILITHHLTPIIPTFTMLSSISYIHESICHHSNESFIVASLFTSIYLHKTISLNAIIIHLILIITSQQNLPKIMNDSFLFFIFTRKFSVSFIIDA